MKANIIKLRTTKSGHERISPINETLKVVLLEYLRNRSRITAKNIGSPDGYFFCGAKGDKCSPGEIRKWFHCARKKTGIQYYGREGGPNVHCLRHTACVHALMNMVRCGKDPYCCLPTLSLFMGHRDIRDTEYYLHLCEEMYPEMVNLERGISSGTNSVIRAAIKRYGNEN